MTEQPVRKHVRLRNFDYSTAGAYFVTVCITERKCLLGFIKDGCFHASQAGAIVAACWEAIPEHNPHWVCDSFVMMPNHIHGIIFSEPQLGTSDSTPVRPLSSVVAGLKAAATKQWRMRNGDPQAVLWQRGFHEHVIRDDSALYRIREYIQNNPLAWELDRENPERISPDPFDDWLKLQGSRLL